jgi:hypothetical protein
MTLTLADDELGKSARSFDTTEADMTQTLKWMSQAAGDLEKVNAETPISVVEKTPEADRLEKWIKSGKMLANGDPLALVNIFANDLPGRFSSIMEDLYYSYQDSLAGRKVKTSIATVGGIGVGAAIGFGIGTFVLPGIGSAIGGSVGALIASGSMLGGVLGCTILSAGAGSFIGNKFADKFFKHEKHYELSKRITRKLKADIGISTKVALLMNSYLYNRAKATQNPNCKKAYKMLRKQGIMGANPKIFIEVSHYFCHELTLLQNEMSKTRDPQALNILKQECDSVYFILKNLQKAPGIYKDTKAKIQLALLAFENQEPKNENQLDDLNDKFQKNVKEMIPDIRVENVVSNKNANPPFHRQYIIKEEDELPEILLDEQQVGNQYFATKMLMDIDQSAELDVKQVKKITTLMLAQAKAQFDTTSDKHFEISVDGDDKLAILLMAAALKAGYSPSLDGSEYPENTSVEKKRKQHILKTAQELAQTSFAKTQHRQ